MYIRKQNTIAIHERDYNASNKLKLEDVGNLDNAVVQCHCFNRNHGT